MTSTPNPPAAPAAAEQQGDTRPRRDNALTTLTNYLIVSGMLTCAAIGAAQLGLQLLPTWNAWYVPVLGFLLALESAYMTRFVRYGRLPAPWYVLRGVEAVTLFLMLRALLGKNKHLKAKKKKKTGVLAKKKSRMKTIAKSKKGKDYRVLEKNLYGTIG